MTEPFAPNRILITGASGGLGSALARHYADKFGRSGVNLSLWGRDAARLEAISHDCRRMGARVAVRSLDIMDVDAALDAIAAEDAEEPFDLALFASGRGDVRETDALIESGPLVARLGIVNFTAPAAMAAAMAGRMADRRRGRIVLVGSAAAFHALPFAAAYSGTKAGLAHFTEALRIASAPHGVRVTLVSPGFIDTAAGRRVPGPKPMLMAPEAVASRIAQAVGAEKAHAVMPWPFVVLRGLDRLLPRPIRDRVLRGLSPPG